MKGARENTPFCRQTSRPIFLFEKKRNCKKKKIIRINEYRSIRFSFQNKKVQAWNIVERFLEKLSNINLRSKFVLSTLELLEFLTREYCYEKVYIVTKY